MFKEFESVAPRKNVGGSIARSSWAFSADVLGLSWSSGAIVVAVGGWMQFSVFMSDFIYSPHSSSWV